MTTVSRGTQAFLKTTHHLTTQAQREGTNLTKAQVTKALGNLSADGRVSQADVKAAKTLLDSAPLTAGAKEALQNFVKAGPRSTDHSNSPLSVRVRSGEAGGHVVRGGGEHGGGHHVRGGGETGGGRVVRGGGESGGGGHVVRGGGESGGGHVVRGGGESGGGGHVVRGGGE